MSKLSAKESKELLGILSTRFEQNTKRHAGINWADVLLKLNANPTKLWSLNEMEKTGGEPDVIGFDKKAGEYLFCDCSIESPAGRRSLCYDKEALDSRKENKPAGSAVQMAAAMCIELLSVEQYHQLQKIVSVDLKTSSWVVTPANIRKLGGSLFGDFRYQTVFIYHNGAQSYYAARGFRGLLKV